MQNAGAQLLHCGHLALANVAWCAGDPERSLWSECGYGNRHQLQKRHHQAAAETPFIWKPLVCWFCAVHGMGGCLGPAWAVLSDSFHGVFSWAFPQPSKIKHDNLFPWHIWELPVLRLPWAFHFQAFLLWRVLQEHILEAFVMQSCYSWNNIAS